MTRKDAIYTEPNGDFFIEVFEEKQSNKLFALVFLGPTTERPEHMTLSNSDMNYVVKKAIEWISRKRSRPVEEEK